MTLTYSNYLKVDELLALQKPLSDGPEHDETLFIIIHQVYELWFKQVLHECRRLRRSLESNNAADARKTLKRVLTIFKTLVGQVDILETMTPVSFNSFRDRLETASGFQSVQFREVEIFLGCRHPAALRHLPEGSPERQRLEELTHSPSLYDAFLRFLKLNGYPVPESVLQRDLTESNPETPEVQDILVGIYKKGSDIIQLCELLVDLDEGMQEWRYRHMKMVERVIGRKRGTGGSAGMEYLKKTLENPAFPDLWAIRVKL